MQTTRLATVPFPRLLGKTRLGETPRLAQDMGRLLSEVGISYGALGPALPELPVSYAVIPEAIAAAGNIFFSGLMAEPRHGIVLAGGDCLRGDHPAQCHQPAKRLCQPAVRRTGKCTRRVAVLPGCLPRGRGTPFQPGDGGGGCGGAGFRVGTHHQRGQRILVDLLEENAHTLVRVADLLKFKYQIRFGGIDFSLAPFPERSRSSGAAVEAMGVPRVGLHGSLAAAAILTGAIDQAKFPHTGFCGFFQPVLEDAVLAERAADGTLTIKDLLLHSAVCGTGLDTVPLAGDVTTGQLSALLLDVCALALRLDKPLTARLMPIPGKQAGDKTDFDFGYFANSRVMKLEAEALGKALGGNETFLVQKRIPR